jgi:hypothetical protein
MKKSNKKLKQKQKQKQKQTVIVNIDNSKKTARRKPSKGTSQPKQPQPTIIPQPIYIPQYNYPAPPPVFQQPQPERKPFSTEPEKPSGFQPNPVNDIILDPINPLPTAESGGIDPMIDAIRRQMNNGNPEPPRPRRVRVRPSSPPPDEWGYVDRAENIVLPQTFTLPPPRPDLNRRTPTFAPLAPSSALVPYVPRESLFDAPQEEPIVLPPLPDSDYDEESVVEVEGGPRPLLPVVRVEGVRGSLAIGDTSRPKSRRKQCQKITKEGFQCSRMSVGNYMFCSQHLKIAIEDDDI